MAISKLNETLIGREVERLFSEMSARRGGLCDNPVTGARFVYGLDPIKPQMKAAHRALIARECFALEAPPDAPSLPINSRDWTLGKYSGGPLTWFTAQYARSMNPKYDVKQHPCFVDYVSGILWEHENIGGVSTLPFSPEELTELKKRFPPQRLEGLQCFCWIAPKHKKPTKQSGRLS